jgi:F-type H+-transporting ATPase subunit delta
MHEAPTTPRKFTKLPTYDTGEWRAAFVYAQSLLRAAEKAKVTDSVVQEFNSLIADVLDRLPQLEALWQSAVVDEEAKAVMVKKAFTGKASPVFLSFLQVVARHGRLSMLRLIHLALEEELNKARGKVRVLVSVAAPLDKAAEGKIIESVRQRLNLEAVLEVQVHPELIGGIVVKVGDRVFDGSVATQLERLREKMLNRSVHEIQSRRDRFSSPN